ncbi:hypothetical protein Tco_1223118 [Tanacetum coccineum]
MDVLVTLEGGVEGGGSGSVMIGYGVVLSGVCVSGVFGSIMFGEELYISVVLVGVDECCGDDEVEEMGVGSGCFGFENGNCVSSKRTFMLVMVL